MVCLVLSFAAGLTEAESQSSPSSSDKESQHVLSDVSLQKSNNSGLNNSTSPGHSGLSNGISHKSPNTSRLDIRLSHIPSNNSGLGNNISHKSLDHAGLNSASPQFPVVSNSTHMAASRGLSDTEGLTREQPTVSPCFGRGRGAIAAALGISKSQS